jgi:hypothetical protein
MSILAYWLNGGGDYCWAVEWRRNLFEWELELYQNLLEVICGTSLSGAADNWVWIEADDGVFSVKSCYNLFSRLVFNNSGLSSLDCFVFKNIWRSSAPRKVCAFAWQATIDKIPSRVNLAHRGVNLKNIMVESISLLGSFSFALVLVLYGVELCIAVLNHTYSTSILFNIVPLFYLI